MKSGPLLQATGIIVIGISIVWWAVRKGSSSSPNNERTPIIPNPGYLLGLALGASMGLMFGVVFLNIALGASLGLCFAAAFGVLFGTHYANKKEN